MNCFSHFDTLFFVGALFFSSATVSAGCLVPVIEYHEISYCVLAGDYAGAEGAADKLIQRYPDEPAGYLFKAAVIQYESIDYEDLSREGEFKESIAAVGKLARDRMHDDPEDLWARYYLGSAEGMEGSWRVSAGETAGGILQGRAGGKHMQAIIEKDSTFHDASLLLGSYRFWSSVALKPLSWLPMIGGDIEGGLLMVKSAIDLGRLSCPLAETVYIEMLLAHDPSMAARNAERMLSQHPDCRLFAWQLGEAYKKLECYDEAVRIYTALVENFTLDNKDDGSGRLRAWWKLAVLAKTIGKTDDCEYFCHKVAAFGSDPVVSRRQKRRIDEAIKMLKELEK